MLYCITSNEDKVKAAQHWLEKYNIFLESKPFEFIEIQSESIEEIALYKARQAFQGLHHPLVVNDAGWYIPSLRGFPGPFMKYMNDWLTHDDFLRLLEPYEDRSVILREVVIYKDENEEKSIVHDYHGVFLIKPQGEGAPGRSLVSLRKDGKSIAKSWEDGEASAHEETVWDKFAKWYKNRQK